MATNSTQDPTLIVFRAKKFKPDRLTEWPKNTGAGSTVLVQGVLHVECVYTILIIYSFKRLVSKVFLKNNLCLR